MLGRMEALMESDEWIPTPGTQFICGNCDMPYLLYGDHRCSNYPAIPVPGPVGPTTYQVTVNGVGHPEMVTLEAYQAMQAERDAATTRAEKAERELAAIKESPGWHP